MTRMHGPVLDIKACVRYVCIVVCQFVVHTTPEVQDREHLHYRISILVQTQLQCENQPIHPIEFVLFLVKRYLEY